MNIGLKAIRAVCLDDGIPFESIPSEIERRAAAYRRVFTNCSITPMALAKHWRRVVAEDVRVSSEQAAINALRSSAHGEIRL